MNYLGVMHSDASWWRAHVALPHIIGEHIEDPRSGVEVGVAFGSMSIWLTRLIPGLSMIGVDPFAAYDPDDEMSEYMVQEGDEVCKFVHWRFETERHDRLTLWRKTSREAAEMVADASQDFVFIDADHRYESVLEDIRLWRPKVKPGGLLCGHDYSGGFPGVVQAVHESFPAGAQHHAPSTIWFARVA
jgi:predicted O-methyltransferase YrrM